MVKLGKGKYMNNCYFCIKGKLKKQKVDIVRYWGKELIALNDVPALVCEQCGEKYFEAKTSHKIDKLIQGALKRKSSFPKLDVPVVQFYPPT